jgi:hypothetical protein
MVDPASPASPQAVLKRAAWVVAVIAAGALVYAGLRFRQQRRYEAAPLTPQPEDPEHRKELQATSDVYMALWNAPEGATPCDTVYNAFQALQAATEARHLPPMIKPLPPRDQFVPLCSALPVDDQKCLVPKYKKQFPDVCADRARQMRTTAAGASLVAMISLDGKANDDTESPVPSSANH